MGRLGFGDGGLGRGGTGDVALHGDTANVGGDTLGALKIDIQNRHLGAGRGERPRGALAQPAGAAGDQRGVSLNVHNRLLACCDRGSLLSVIMGRAGAPTGAAATRQTGAK